MASGSWQNDGNMDEYCRTAVARLFIYQGKKGTAIKIRFELLLKTFKADEMDSMRKSGAVEEFTEREQLLLDISSLMDDFVSLQKTNQQANAAKQAGIEMSGEIVRRMAIDGPAKDAESSSEESDDDESDPESNKDSSNESGKGKGKRKKCPSRKKRKPMKREKLDQLMATIQGAIHESAQSEKDKLAFKTERLKLDRLESERRAANDAAMHQFLAQMGDVMKMFFNKQN